MDVKLSVPLLIVKGSGIIDLPPVLKRDPLKSTITCDSLYFNNNPSARNEPYFVVCSGSWYYNHKHEPKKNILGMFQNKATANIVSFNFPAPLTRLQENLEIEIIDLNGKRVENVSCMAVCHIHGQVSNRLLAI